MLPLVNNRARGGNNIPTTSIGRKPSGGGTVKRAVRDTIYNPDEYAADWETVEI